MVRIGLLSVCAVFALLAIAIALEAPGPHATGSLGSGQKRDRLATADATPAGDRLASLETGIRSDDTAGNPGLSSGRSFGERFFYDPRFTSFEERFAVTGVRPAGPAAVDGVAASATAPVERHTRPPAAASAAQEPPRTALRRPAQKLAMLTRAHLELPSGHNGGAAPRLDIDGRTAVYDITARAVYLPNGRKLEAHSGLGGHMDDPRAVTLKGRGPTPPNVYRLVLRERPFHGVRAIRLIPVDESRMHGRDGILAHSYLLGPSGQSNGCVSLDDYPAFLRAFLDGDVNRMVVVERLDTAPGPKPGLEWVAEAFGKLFKPNGTVGRDQAADRGIALSYQ